MFDDFTLSTVDVGEVTLRVRVGGAGPPVLLLHGHPRTHTTWWQVAPLLADRFTVVCPDLRGYGSSTSPPSTGDDAAYSKRAMAGDCRALMAGLGHESFAVAGHDRGSYVAMRLAMDHPAAVRRLAVLDSVPIGEALARAGARFAALWWHWFFLGLPDGPAERVINADPDAWYHLDAGRMGEENHADALAAVRDPATVHAMVGDYRAGLTVDRAADDADRLAGNRIGCPTLVLWSRHDDMEALYGDPVAVWRDWADDVRGGVIESGHHMAEEAPEQLAAALGDFFS